MKNPGILARGLGIALVLAAAACGRAVEPAPGRTSTLADSPSSAESASPAAPAEPASPSRTIVVEPNGLDVASFGRPMNEVVPLLVGLLGSPVYDDRMHGDLPLGYLGMGSTARRLDFGGLYVVFGDWPTRYRDDGVLHLLGWGVTRRRTENGARLVTGEGVSVGARTSRLEAVFGSSLELPPGWCGGPVWYFVAGSDQDSQLVGSLAVRPYGATRSTWSTASVDARVSWLSAGEQQEDWGGVRFTC